jgi:hypothetical protein
VADSAKAVAAAAKWWARRHTCMRRTPACSPMQAIIACTASLLAASALPVVSYIYVFQYAATELGPFAWTHWAVVGFACLLGLSAHSLNHRGEPCWAWTSQQHAASMQGARLSAS